MNQTVIPLSSANDNSIDNTKRAIAGVTEFISFVVPVFNEQESLPLFHAELLSFLDQNQFAKFEVVYVNDGSLDGSRQTLQSIAVNDKRVCVVNLSRNFGKEVALTAGLDHATGEAAVLIDADLQHPLHVVLDFIQHWRSGSDVVYAVQKKPQTKLTAKSCLARVPFCFFPSRRTIRNPAKCWRLSFVVSTSSRQIESNA